MLGFCQDAHESKPPAQPLEKEINSLQQRVLEKSKESVDLSANFNAKMRELDHEKQVTCM